LMTTKFDFRKKIEIKNPSKVKIKTKEIIIIFLLNIINTLAFKYFYH